jgi:hypothetical protein
LNIKAPDALLTTSPWGPALKVYAYTPGMDSSFSISKAILNKIATELIGEPNPQPGIKLYCVNCEIKGNMQVTASLSVSITSGLTKGIFSLTGNIFAGLYVGLDAFSRVDKNIQYDLLKVNLAGFSIPKIISVGPAIDLSVSADFFVGTEGQFLVGTGLTWPAVAATLNLLHGDQSTQSGWTPAVTYQVLGYGSLGVTTTLGLPAGLTFGIDVLNGKYTKSVKLTDTPGVAATRKFPNGLPAFP